MDREEYLLQKFNDMLDIGIYGKYKLHKNEVLRTHREFINDNIIFSIEDNIDFFKDIPLEAIELIFDELIKLLKEYSYLLGQKALQRNIYIMEMVDSNKMPLDTNVKILFELDYDKKSIPKREPKSNIENDIKTIREYQNFLIKVYHIYTENDIVKSHTKAPDYILDTYKNNEDIIKDLEDKSFSIVQKYNYYTIDVDKNKIKAFLKEINKEFKLRNSIGAKELVDSLPTSFIPK